MATNTLYSKVNYTGDGTTKSFVVPFPYLYVNDVHLFVDDEEVNVYPVISHDDPPSGYEAHWYSSNTLRFITAPDSDAEIIIQRITNRAAPEVEFENSSILTEEDLNLIATQLLYIVQEAYDNFSLDYDEIIEKLDAAMEASQIATSAKNDILTLSGGLATTISNGINAITSAGGTQVTNITSAGDVQAARVENIATSYLTYAGLSWLEATWTLEEAADVDDVINLPDGISYIVGHHHMMLSYDGMVFDRTRWEEIGENETQSSSFTTKIALAAGTELTVRVAPLSSNEEIAISAASVASAAAESASASAETATAAQLEIEELTSQINTTTNNVDEVASATTALDTRVTSLETSLNAIGANLPSVLPAADIMAGKDADGNVITSTYVNVTSAQTVGGAKTYTDSAVFSSGATFSGGITVSSGATFTSDITLNSVNNLIANSDNSKTLMLTGGGINTPLYGAVLSLNGANFQTNSGAFELFACDASKSKTLLGKPDGTLTWNGKGFVYDSGDQTIGGTKTFANTIKSNNNTTIARNVTDQEIQLCGGTSISTGGSFLAWGKDKDSPSYTGAFLCRATLNGTTRYDLLGKPDGTLTWNGVMEFSQTNGGVQVSKSASRKCKLLVGESYVGLYDVANMQWIVRVADNKAYIHYGTLQAVSDKRQKQDISDVNEALLDAWGEVQWQQFRYKKVSDDLQHIGLVAQDVEDILKTHDITATDYGFISHEQNEEDGGESYYISYTDALSIEAAYQRRRADRAEARITALEQRLAEMEQVLASLISPIGDEQTAEPEEPVVEETPTQENE
jgi:FtsZ-binding cell division protein ZapB